LNAAPPGGARYEGSQLLKTRRSHLLSAETQKQNMSATAAGQKKQSTSEGEKAGMGKGGGSDRGGVAGSEGW